MNNDTPWLIIISGPNGAGKTTFHDRILEQNPFFKDAMFANSDIEFAKLVELPENQKIISDLKYSIKEARKNIRKKLLGKFKKTMDSVAGNTQERIYKRNDENKTFWMELYSLSVHLPVEHYDIISGINSKHDLMSRICSPDIHERINAKNKKDHWYKTYERFINTIEVQEILYLHPLTEQLKKLESSLQRIAAEKTLNKVHYAFEHKMNIIFETTGAGNMAARFTRKAKTIYHYRVYSFHPYLLRPELSIARVQHRVENGGHDVPKEIILQRYERSLNNLPSLLSTVNIGIVMDNSGWKPFMPVFAQVDGFIIDFAQCPEYLQEARQKMIEKMPQKSVKELLHLQHDVDIQKMSEEQRKNFAQIVISTLLGQIR